MDNNIESDFLVDHVLGFYAHNYKLCDKAYDVAENKKISQLYKKIDDLNIIDTLYIKSNIVILTANVFYQKILKILKKF